MSQFDVRRVRRCSKHGAKRRQVRWRYHKQRHVSVENGLFCDPQIVEIVIKDGSRLTKTSSRWFLYIYSRFKYVLFSLNSIRLTISGLTPNCENRSVCNCRDTYFRLLSNQKPSLCHGINCSSYEIGTLAIAVHSEMNAIAPYGFIDE